VGDGIYIWIRKKGRGGGGGGGKGGLKGVRTLYVSVRVFIHLGATRARGTGKGGHNLLYRRGEKGAGGRKTKIRKGMSGKWDEWGFGRGKGEQMPLGWSKVK